MSKEIIVKPAQGLKIRKPGAPQHYIHPDGERLVRTTAIVRLLRSKDLVTLKTLPKKDAAGAKPGSAK